MYNQQIFLFIDPFPARSNCFCEMMDWHQNFKKEFIRKKFAHFPLLFNWNSLVLVSIVIKLGILFSPPAKRLNKLYTISNKLKLKFAAIQLSTFKKIFKKKLFLKLSQKNLMICLIVHFFHCLKQKKQ